MKKLVVLCLLMMFLSSGCGSVKDEDLHYKPSEYKHDVANSNIDNFIRNIETNIVGLGYDTDPLIVQNVFFDSITKLEDKITCLKEYQKNLKDETDLTNKEIKSWNDRYDSSITIVEAKLRTVKNEYKKFPKPE